MVANSRLTVRDNPRLVLDRFFIVVCTLAIAFTFWVSGHDWKVSTLPSFQQDADDAGAVVYEGKALRKVAYTGLGVLGMIMLFMPGRTKLHIDSWLSLSVMSFWPRA